MERILRFADVRAATGLSRPTIWRLEHRGEFPKRIQISAGAVGWKQSELEEWISNKASKNGSPKLPDDVLEVSSQVKA